VWIAYDRDDAGESAAAALAEELMAGGIECWRVQFPKGMDANEYALAGKSLEAAIHAAVWLGKGVQAAKEESVPVLAAPAPSLVAAVETEVKSEEVLITLGDRRYRIRGLAKNLSYDLLKVNVLASRGEGFHVDTLDLYTARQRAVFMFIKQAAVELGVKEDLVKRDLGRVLLKLEELQDEQIRAALEPKLATAPAMKDEDRRAALELLTDPKLLDRILRGGGVAAVGVAAGGADPVELGGGKEFVDGGDSRVHP
jgi:DNA primase